MEVSEKLVKYLSKHKTNIIIGTVSLTIVAVFWIINPTQNKFTDVSDKCIDINPGTNDYSRVMVVAKGSFRVTEFYIRTLDYASRKKCFVHEGDVHTLNAFFKKDPGDTTITFKILLMPDDYKADCELSVKVYDIKDQLVGKFPIDTDVLKAKLTSVGSNDTFAAKIQLKH